VLIQHVAVVKASAQPCTCADSNTQTHPRKHPHTHSETTHMFNPPRVVTQNTRHTKSPHKTRGTHTHTATHSHTHTATHTQPHTQTHTQPHTHTHIHTHTHTHTQTHMRGKSSAQNTRHTNVPVATAVAIPGQARLGTKRNVRSLRGAPPKAVLWMPAPPCFTECVGNGLGTTNKWCVCVCV